jgi:hypothetical protein
MIFVEGENYFSRCSVQAPSPCLPAGGRRRTPLSDRDGVQMSAKAAPRGLAIDRKSENLSVGLATRTEDEGWRPLAGKPPDARSSLGGLQWRWLHLGGCADLANMAGSSAPCPEGKPLKVRRPVSSAGC